MGMSTAMWSPGSPPSVSLQVGRVGTLNISPLLFSQSHLIPSHPCSLCSFLFLKQFNFIPASRPLLLLPTCLECSSLSLLTAYPPGHKQPPQKLSSAITNWGFISLIICLFTICQSSIYNFLVCYLNTIIRLQFHGIWGLFLFQTVSLTLWHKKNAICVYWQIK